MLRRAVSCSVLVLSAACSASDGPPPPVASASGGATSEASNAGSAGEVGNGETGSATTGSGAGEPAASEPAAGQGSEPSGTDTGAGAGATAGDGNPGGGSGVTDPVSSGTPSAGSSEGSSAGSGAVDTGAGVESVPGSGATGGGQSSSDAANSGIVVEDDDVLVVDALPPVMVDEADCDNILEVTYRDFNTEHPDFEMQFQGDVVRLGLIEASLDLDGKPVFKDSVGCAPEHDEPQVCTQDYRPTEISINSAETFDQWYRTVEGVNIEFQKELELTETAPGSGVYVFESDMFFPIGDDEGFGKTPSTAFANFLFTTEIHLMFTYEAGQTFTFRGDDDLWIFINDKLALDLGSMHNVEEGTIDFDAQAEALGITPRGVYRMDVFHAERHTFASNFRIETNIGCFIPAPPRVR